MNKVLDLLLDPRFPWHFYKYVRVPKKTTARSKIQLAITFDVEEDFPSKKRKTAQPFLIEIRKILSKFKIKATFFVQGEMIGELSKELRVLKKDGHEIAVHGLRHDNWGNSVWFWSAPPLSCDQKRQDLKEINKIFMKNKLPKPISFRAPNMNTNKCTLDLLGKNGYQVDSSWPSFRVSSALAGSHSRLIETPVSSLTQARIKFIKILPIFDFHPFNLQNVSSMNETQLNRYIQQLLIGQQSKAKTLVFLAHPWEFSSNDAFTYCSKNNYQKIESLIKLLKNSFGARFETMKTLAHG